MLGAKDYKQSVSFHHWSWRQNQGEGRPLDLNSGDPGTGSKAQNRTIWKKCWLRPLRCILYPLTEEFWGLRNDPSQNLEQAGLHVRSNALSSRDCRRSQAKKSGQLLYEMSIHLCSAQKSTKDKAEKKEHWKMGWKDMFSRKSRQRFNENTFSSTQNSEW